jgi:S-adenosylmethionine synthetase
MQLKIFHHYAPPPFQIAERKGRGHPDTLCDSIASAISHHYSNYCLNEFGYVLHHNCDKVGMIGGKVEVEFGHGRLTEPVKFILNGRFSASFGGREIPYREIATKVIKDYLSAVLVNFDANRDLEIIDLIHNNSSPGAVGTSAEIPVAGSRLVYFNPRDKNDLSYVQSLKANDTSIGIGYAPLSVADSVALKLETYLNSAAFKSVYPFIGTDIKIMVVSVEQTIDITIALPFICTLTPDLTFYHAQIKHLIEIMRVFIGELYPSHEVKITVNNRDKPELKEVYLTLTGSSIEMGDEGLVGRGNRLNGVISSTQFVSMEAASGKNPIFHVGNVYNILAQRIAARIYEALGVANHVHLVSQTGRLLRDPWYGIITLASEIDNQHSAVIETIAADELQKVYESSLEAIRQSVPDVSKDK